jgi:peroxiredoxin
LRNSFTGEQQKIFLLSLYFKPYHFLGKSEFMALTASNPFPLGISAPDFLLPDTVSGNNISFQDINGEHGTVVLFICNHCPYVIHINHQIVSIAKEYLSKGIGFVAISSNDVVNYPEDAPDKMSIVAKVLQFPFPYLYDEDQSCAKAYDAACTPDIYLFDSESKLYYHGRLDASRPKNEIPVTGEDLRNALNRLLEGSEIPSQQIPSMGCNIKWK